MTLESLIAQYGYFALFVGTLGEGETVLIAAAFAAHRGLLWLPLVILVAFAGSFAGDQFFFFLGRKKGREYLRKHPSWQARTERVTGLLERHDTLIMAGFRFVYGFRTVTPFAIGMSDVTVGRFMMLNAVGALVWSIAGGLLGYLFGAAFEAIFENVKHYERIALLVILATGGISAVWLRVRRRRIVAKAVHDNK